MHATRDGDYLVFTTDHFSQYGIIAKIPAGLEYAMHWEFTKKTAEFATAGHSFLEQRLF